MNTYKTAFMRYVKDHPMAYADVDDLMGVLYNCYGEKAETERVRAMFRDLQGLRQTMPQEAGEALFDLVCDLCLEKERLAFREGFRVGGQLILELGQLEKEAY